MSDILSETKVQREKVIPGAKYGQWLTLHRSPKVNRSCAAYWICRCDCGFERTIRASLLVDGVNVACQCSKGSTMLRIKNTWDSILGCQIICGDCGQVCSRTGPTQRYCEQCSEIRAAARKMKWSKSNTPDHDKQKLWRGNRKGRIAIAGEEISERHRLTVDTVFSQSEGMAWVRRVSVPFTYALSKNHHAQMSARGHVFLRKQSREARARVSEEVRLAVAGAPIVQNKLWIDLVVQKPNHRGDAINVLDLVCDAIKVATGVDDRWFCLARVDWQIVKREPCILIGVDQYDSDNVQACASCGRLLQVASFYKNKRTPLGASRECKDCHLAGNRKPVV